MPTNAPQSNNQQQQEEDEFLAWINDTPGTATSPQGSQVAGGGGEGAPSQSAQAASPKKPRDRVTGGGAFSLGFGDTAAFGFLDELGAVADSIGLPTPGARRENIWNSDKSFGEIWAANVAENRSILQEAQDDHGGSYLTGQVAGALAIPIGSGAKGAYQVAKVGAVQGAVYGAGSGEGLSDRATGAARDAVIGGALGGVLGKVMSRFGGKGAGAAETAAEEGVGRAARKAGMAGAEDLTQGAAEILGETKGGQLIIREARSAADEAAEEAFSITPAAFEKGAEAPSARAALEELQGYVTSAAARIRKEGDRAIDVTWENTPQVAARTGEWRVGKLGSGEDARGLIRAMAEGVTSKTRKSDEELAKSALGVAADMGEDPEAILAAAKSMAGELGDVDNTMMALRTVYANMSQEITDLHLMNIDWTTASDDMVEEAVNRIHNLASMSESVQAAKTGLGRGLRVNKLPTADEYLEQIKKAAAGEAPPHDPSKVQLPVSRSDLDDWFEMWGATGGDPKRQSDLMQGILTRPKAGHYLRSSFANFFTASILSAPRTVALNIVGPGVISTIRQVERIGGAATLAINPLKTRAERIAARRVAQNSAKAFVQTFGDIQDAFRMAVVAGKRNGTVIGGNKAFDTQTAYDSMSKNLRSIAERQGQITKWESRAYALGDAINVWPKAFARLNNGLDEFSKRLAYNGEVRVNAMVEAAERGLKGDAFRSFVTKAMQESTDEVGAATNQQLLRSAQRTTLTATVGEEGSQLRKFGNYVQGVRHSVPESRFILPIFNVPMNALGETLRRLPIAGVPGLNKVMFRETARELAGELGPVAQADAHGRVLLGSAFLLAGAMLNRAGTLTGAGPQEPTDRKVWLTTHQPYSIKVGDQWVRYDKFDILGGLLAIPATVADATIYSDDDQSASDIAWAGAGALAQWFKDKAALRTATGLLALGEDPTMTAKQVANQTGGAIASGFYPAAARTLITDAMTNPYMPMRRGWEDYVAAALPFNNVEPVRNILGEPIKKSLNSVLEAMVPVSLEQAISAEDDAVLTELSRLYEETGYGAGADTTMMTQGQFADKDVKLESGMSMYGRTMQLRQTIVVDGFTLREALADLFESPDYRYGIDQGPGRKTNFQGEMSRGEMVSKVFTRYNKAIKAQLAEESDIARDYMTAARAKKVDTTYLRDISVEQLVENPDLYKASGLFKADYEPEGMGHQLVQAIEEQK